MSRALFKSTSAVSSMTLLSRIMGFVRDMVLASVFGAVAGFDAFLVAFKIPNFMRRLFAEGAFSQAFVPVLSEYRQTRSETEVQDFVNHVASALAVALLIIVVFAEILTPLLVMLFAPGFINEPERFGLARQMLQITFPYILLISLAAFAGAVANTYGSFAVPAFTPTLFNIALIIAAVVGSHYFAHPIIVLAWGVMAGGIVQLAFQWPMLRKWQLLPRFRLNWEDPGVRRVMKLMVPALFGVSVAQLSLLVDTIFASFLRVGSISWLYYSDRIIYFPLGMFGVAIATVILPHLSRKHASHSSGEFSEVLDWGLRLVVVIGLPAAVGILVLAGPLMATLFGYGKFNAFDVVMGSRSLMAYAIGLPAFMLIKVLASGFYSRQDIRTPVRIAVIAMTTCMVLNGVLIFPLAHAGLALATSLGAIVNAGLLGWILLRREIYQPRYDWRKYVARVLLANAVLAVLLLILAPGLHTWLGWRWYQRGSCLALLMGIAIVGYFGCLWLSGMRWHHFKVQAAD
ncbi:MAG: murein biosynthesis integral membrane protein MurJ [Gammaproteobacteria bacterium]